MGRHAGECAAGFFGQVEPGFAQPVVDRTAFLAQHVTIRHVATDDEPLSEPVVLILTSLASMPKHGYALLKDVELLSEGRVRLSTGTLYGAIRRLLEDGWIERFEQQDTSRDKQAYRVTAKGKAQLNSEIARLRHLVQAAAMRLGLKGAR